MPKMPQLEIEDKASRQLLVEHRPLSSVSRWRNWAAAPHHRALAEGSRPRSLMVTAIRAFSSAARSSLLRRIVPTQENRDALAP
jgi:hypothetical protein